MFNRVILIGRLATDPDMRYTPSGVGVCTFRLAVDRPFTNQSGEREADFLTIKVWREQGERVNQYMAKGRLVAVEGRIETRSWVAQDGQKRNAVEIVADTVKFLDRAPEGQQGGRRDTHDHSGDPDRMEPQASAPRYTPPVEPTEAPGGFDAPMEGPGVGDPFADE